jgi:hypothetical protein
VSQEANRLEWIPCLVSLFVVFVLNDENHVKSRQNGRLEIDVLVLV